MTDETGVAEEAPARVDPEADHSEPERERAAARPDQHEPESDLADSTGNNRESDAHRLAGEADQPEADTVHLDTAHDGAVQGGAVQGGAVQGGAVQGGAVQGGAVQGGAVQGGAVQDGAVQGGAVQDGAVQDGAVHDEAGQLPGAPIGGEGGESGQAEPDWDESVVVATGLEAPGESTAGYRKTDDGQHESVEARPDTESEDARVGSESEDAREGNEAEDSREGNEAKVGPEAEVGQGGSVAVGGEVGEGQTEIEVAAEEVIDDVTMRRAVEAILMVTDEPLPAVTLARAVGRATGDVAEALTSLAEEYAEQGRGFELREVAGGWRYYTREDAAPYVERFVLDGQQARLTQAALETLAVIAYKQPVSRARVSAIRGVNVDGVVRTLVTRGLVEEAGTDTDSQATLYRTTSYFLERMGMQSLEDLPELAPYLPDMDDVEDELIRQAAPPETGPDPVAGPGAVAGPDVVAETGTEAETDAEAEPGAEAGPGVVAGTDAGGRRGDVQASVDAGEESARPDE